jgi:hypothetical protein
MDRRACAHERLLRCRLSVLASLHEIFPEQEPPERFRLVLDDIFLDKNDQESELT